MALLSEERLLQFSRFLAFARLLRPLNLAGIGLAAWAGARLAAREPSVATVLVPILIGAFGYARNDAVDLAAGPVNRPGRPVPSGAVSALAASIVAWSALVAAGVALTTIPHPSGAWVIALAAAITLYLYSPWLKDRGAVGPLAIAALTFFAVLWGAYGAPRVGLAALCGLLAAATQFALECVKQLEDARGDRSAGRTTWVIRSGKTVVTRAARLGLIAALLLLPLPVSAGGLASAAYARIAVPCVALALLVSLAFLGVKKPDYALVSKLIKAALFVGLVVLAWMG